MTDVLVERSGFLASLEGLLGEALAGAGRLVFLGGEAGVGKTALAAALAELAAGTAVRRGSCDNITTAEALGPILDALPAQRGRRAAARGCRGLGPGPGRRFSRTGGNPFYVTEVLAAGADRAGHRARRGARARGPALASRAEVAGAASVLGRRAEADLLAAVRGSSWPRSTSAWTAACSLSTVTDSRATGAAQRWLSRLSWFLGRNEDSERYAVAAVATLEPLGPGRELAMAYSNLAQLRMLAYGVAEAVRWGEAAIGLARDAGDRETEMHALNNVGTALSDAGDAAEGRHGYRAASLDLALADDAHEHAARAYTNLGVTAVMNRSLTDADRYLKAGIAYCTDRDLDTWRLYMTAWLARSLAEQGRYAAAGQHLAGVLRHPNLSPITRVSALPVAGVLAARCGRDGTAALDEALPIAIQTGESQRLVPVAAARAEAAWIAGRTGAPAGCECRAGRGRRAAPARPGSPRGRPRCSRSWPTACPMPRSRSGWCCRRRPWATTSQPCCASSGTDPVAGGRRGAAAGSHPAKIGNTPDAQPGSVAPIQSR